MATQLDKLKSEYLRSLGKHPLIDLLPENSLGKQAKQALLSKAR